VTPNGVQSMRTMHGRQKETPPDLGICAGYSSHSHHAQMGFALSYKDRIGEAGNVATPTISSTNEAMVSDSARRSSLDFPCTSGNTTVRESRFRIKLIQFRDRYHPAVRMA